MFFFRHPRATQGTLLIEVLLSMVLLASFMMPLMVLLQSNGALSKLSDFQRIRQVVINQVLSNVDPENPDFYNAYNKTTMQTLTFNGTTIPYITKVDDTSASAFRHTLDIYIYQNATDSLSTPLYKYSQVYDLDEVRIDCGETTLGVVDSSGLIWSPDIQYDPTTNKRHAGWYTAGAGASTTAGTVVNVSSANNALYNSYRSAGTTAGNSFEYRFDVPNDNYTVQLYFAELSGSTTRTLDVSLEGSVPSNPSMSGFNAYTAAGSTNLKAVERTIPVTVSDGVLNLVVTTKTAGQDARLMSVVVRRTPS